MRLHEILKGTLYIGYNCIGMFKCLHNINRSNIAVLSVFICTAINITNGGMHIYT